MAGSGVTLYAVTAAGNKAVIGTIDWREDVYMPSQINDNLGQIMADIRAMANSVANGWLEVGDGDGVYTATYVSANSFRFDGVDVTSIYRTGMRILVAAPTPSFLPGTVTTSVFATHTTITVAWDAGGLSNEPITAVFVGTGSSALSLPVATYTSAGGAELATQAEVDYGTDEQRIVTPATLAASPRKSHRNILGRNGGFEVWQRGAGGSAHVPVTGGPAYTCDGWSLWAAGGALMGAAQVAGLTSGSRHGAFVYRAATQPAGLVVFEFPLDTDEIAPARNSLVTLSFTMHASATFTPAGRTVGVKFTTGTGAPTKTILGFTGSVDVIGTSVAPTTTAVRYTVTSLIPVPVNATQASVAFSWTTVGAAVTTEDAVYIDDVQLEIGSVATPFERRPFEQELLACRRHYQKSFDYGIAPVVNSATANGWSSIPQASGAVGNLSGWATPFSPSLRVVPTMTLYNPNAANAQARNAIISVDCTSTGTYVIAQNHFSISWTTAAGSSVGQSNAIHWQADAGI